jgi:hypothetical protein
MLFLEDAIVPGDDASHCVRHATALAGEAPAGDQARLRASIITAGRRRAAESLT